LFCRTPTEKANQLTRVSALLSPDSTLVAMGFSGIKMPPKSGIKGTPGRPRNPYDPVEISLKVDPDFAATLREIAPSLGVSGHTAAARQILTDAIQKHRRRRRREG
jgi:hypothetical protein